jgi:hypothetical protein
MCALCANPCPDSIENTHNDTCVELLTNPADAIWEEDTDIEARKETCSLNDNVSHGGVVKGLPGCCAFGIADPCQNDALVEVDTVVCDVTVCNVSQCKGIRLIYNLQ